MNNLYSYSEKNTTFLSQTSKIIGYLMIVLFCFSSSIFAQVTGDYRSVASGNWTTLASWQYYNGSSWVTPSGTTPQGYPGQYAGTNAVSVQASHTITIGTSGITTQTMGTVTINGTLYLNAVNTGSGTNFTLNTNNLIVTPALSPVATIYFNNKAHLLLPSGANLQVGAGGLSQSTCSNNQDIQIGGVAYSACNGGGGNPTFADLMNSGGPGSASSNSPVCTGSTLTLTATAPVATSGGPYTYQYQWSGAGISTPAYSNSASYNITNTNTSNHGGTYTVIIKRNDGVLSTVTTNTVINPTSVGGSVSNSGSATICLNSNTGVMTLSGHVGSIVRWEKRLNSAATWTSISNTTTTYSETPSSVGSWEYRAVVKSGSCSEANSSSFTVTVNPDLTITLVDTNSLGCTETTSSKLYYSATSGNANAVNIDFNATANSAGVQDIPNHAVTSSAGEITLQFGWSTPPGVYYGVLTVVNTSFNCPGISYPVTLTISSATPTTINTQPSNKSICAGSNTSFSVTVSSGTPNYQWQVSTNGGSNFSNLTNTGVYTNVTAATMNITGATSGMNNYLYRCVLSGCAATVNSNSATLNVLTAVSINPFSSPTLARCQAAETITRTTTTNNSSAVTYSLDATTAAFTGNSIVASTGEVTYAAGWSGTTIITASATGCNGTVTTTLTITTNPIPSTPVVGTITQPNCATPTGSVALSGLPASGTLFRTGTSSASTPITGTSMTVSGLASGTYQFYVNNNTCPSSSTGNVVINTIAKTWNGTWSPAGAPTSSNTVIINANYNTATDGNIDACSLTINSGRTMTISSGNSVIIQNHLTVNGTINVQDTGNLVMVNDSGVVSGTGTTNVTRTTSSLMPSDYVFWSTPVSSTSISATFTGWRTGNAYLYNYSNFADGNGDGLDDNGDVWVATGTMIPAIGCIIKSPSAGGARTITFSGQVNNGIQTVGGIAGSCLVGNPYPSAISADDFILENAGVIEDGIGFWTHNTAIQLATNIPGKAGSGVYAYTSDDYAMYSLSGGTAAGSGGAIPSGNIGTGQGFFVKKVTASDVVFNNAMRTNGSTPISNSDFFKTKESKNKKTAAIEKNRVWLNLTNNQGAFKQTLVGYIGGATNEVDPLYDATTLDGNDFVDFYSINQEESLVIQGRALPFNTKDKVPLGYKSKIAGEFKIGIAQADGLLAKQAVYLEDKLLDTVADLKKGDYTFTTEKGVFKERFVLKYGDENLSKFSTSKNIIVSVKDKKITIDSVLEKIAKIQIFDVTGKLLYTRENINNISFAIADLNFANQVLIVKITLENGEVITEKVIY